MNVLMFLAYSITSNGLRSIEIYSLLSKSIQCILFESITVTVTYHTSFHFKNFYFQMDAGV